MNRPAALPRFFPLLVSACFALTACGTQSPEAPAETSEAPTETGPFEEVQAAAGLDFVHVNGRTGELYFHEMMGSGVALVDVDNDGDLDVYLVQSGAMEEPRSEMDRLFRNELMETGELHFTDVTEATGLKASGYGMGVATGDFDNDGWTDLYLTNFGEDQLWRNRGDGTFELANARLPDGRGNRRWGVPALFFDADRDGRLDLFVGNYVDFQIATHKRCTTELGEPNYCGPLSYASQEDAFYRNLGGRFEEVGGTIGLRSASTTGSGGALGAVAADFNGDGRPDLYVGNDGMPNHLWIQQGDGTFRDEALLAGAAVNQAGQPEASMGMVADDFDGDGSADLFVAHLTRETNTLYLNDGTGLFEDASTPSGLGAASWEMTAFGTGLLDFDGDGLRDLLVVNGAVKILESLRLAGDPFPLHQPNQLFHRRSDGTFEEVAETGAPFARSEVSRGAAFGDLDNDGDTDLVVTNSGAPARLLLNRRDPRATLDRWLGLAVRLGEEHGRRYALGAVVEIFVPGREKPLRRRVHTDGSYASAGDPRLLVTLKEPAERVRVRVRWPDGPLDRWGVWEGWNKVPTGRYTELVRGEGQEEP